MLTDPRWVSDHLDDPDVRLVEVDVSGASYEQGHLPGATLWDAYKDLRHPDFTPIGREELDRILGRAGIGADTAVVLYGYAPYLGYWLLDRHGHHRIRVMEGGRDGWERSGGAWSTEVPAPSSVTYERGTENARLVTTLDQTRDAIDDPDAVILDVRSPEEFTGERFWPSGATEDFGRAGHIPGAIHVPVDALEANGSPRDDDELRRVYEAAGVTPDRRAIVYCTIGNRASRVAFALKHRLGYPDVAVYYGSWSEWGHRSDAPVEV